jgi:hypothetical protein
MSIQNKNVKEPKYQTRTIDLKKDQEYGISRTCLIKNLKIIEPNITGTMIINGVKIKSDDNTFDFLDGKNFDIEKIRKTLRDIIPINEEENNLCAVESTLFGTQLQATEYYTYFSTEYLFNMIFTGSLCVLFEFSSSEKIPDIIQLEEIYAISDTQYKYFEKSQINNPKTLDTNIQIFTLDS